MGRVMHWRARYASLLVAAPLLLAGCRGADAGSGPYAREVADAIPRIEKAIGVPFKHPPRVEERTREEVHAFLLKQFNESKSAQSLAGEEVAQKLLGLIPPAMDLRAFLIKVLDEQIVGYYDPALKTLYVVKGADEQMVGITIAHELIHALQDQYVNLDSIQKSIGDADRATAAQAVIEGQATYEQMMIMGGGADNIALRVGGRDAMREMIRERMGSMPVMATAPMVIQESLLFPYLSGADFVQRFKEQKGATNPLLAMPRSTEQILHTPAYFGATPDEPSVVSLPAPSGATTVYENDLGEFGTRLFLYQHLGDQTTAARAAAGWDGDRYVVVEGAGGRGIVWASVWDTSLEAAEFSDAAVRATARRTGSAERRMAGGGSTFASKGRTTTITTFTVNDRAVVLYSDLPDAMSRTVVDPSKIRVASH
ncbi:MAG: hypothetical protein JWN79_2125 [Gemmatimonadetes bacterium]|nr:hypothetical protein [Gemmatimonadota bacterium]